MFFFTITTKKPEGRDYIPVFNVTPSAVYMYPVAQIGEQSVFSVRLDRKPDVAIAPTKLYNPSGLYVVVTTTREITDLISIPIAQEVIIKNGAGTAAIIRLP